MIWSSPCKLMCMTDRQVEVLDFLLDDHYALWDFADSFPTQQPDAPDSVIEELLKLIQSGFVALTYGKWFENQTVSIPPEQANLFLKDPASWQPTGQKPGYVLELTEQGRAHLRTIGIGIT